MTNVVLWRYGGRTVTDKIKTDLISIADFALAFPGAMCPNNVKRGAKGSKYDLKQAIIG